MNRLVSKYLFYYPATLVKGEFVGPYLRDFRRFQYLPRQRIFDYQASMLKNLLDYASKNSEYYKDLLADVSYEKINSDNMNEVLRNIPITTKQNLLSSGSRIVTDYSSFAVSKTTGGSTGEPVKILKNAGALARERAATWRAYEWAGVTIGDPQARFWGQPHSLSDGYKAKVIDLIANRKRISAFNLSDESLMKYYYVLSKFKPAYLYGYVSVITKFADFIGRLKLEPIRSLSCVITTSEVLTSADRQTIRDGFNVPVFNEYGCGEVGSIAHECEHGNMHLMSENLIVETDSSSSSGEVLVTDLFNYSMPLVRYRVGDFATLSEEYCGCGRTLPLISSVHGRAYDLIKTQRGVLIHPESVMYIFEDIQKKIQAFRQFQVTQESIRHFSVCVVPTERWSSDIRNIIEVAMKKHIGEEISISFKEVEQITREKSGKMRVIRSYI